MKNLIEQGNEVFFVRCDAVLKNCYFNRVHNIVGCAACQSRQDTVFTLSGLKPANILSLKNLTEADVASIPVFTSSEELFAFSFHGVDIGRGAASSIISYFRDFDLTSEKYGTWIDIELRKAINVLLNFELFFEKVKPDIVYLFNGRFAEVYPVMELAKQKNIPFKTVEAGARKNYELFNNGLPHSILLRTSQIKHLWETESDSEKRKKIGEAWYEKKRFGDEEYERSHTLQQIKDSLPADFNPNRRNILILNSSEDEIKAIQEWNSSLYSNQNEALRQIVEAFEGDSTFHFILRVHPNLGKVSNRQIEEIRTMNYPNLTVVDPNDPADTYTLIENCEKIIAFSSTSGIEATFWGKPAILFGNSFYRHLGATYTPNSFNELEELIRARLKPIEKDLTLPYGFYMSTYGIKPVHFSFDGLNNSTFDGVKLRKVYPSALLYFFRYLKYFSHWKRLFRSYYREPFSLSSWKKML